MPAVDATVRLFPGSSENFIGNKISSCHRQNERGMCAVRGRQPRRKQNEGSGSMRQLTAKRILPAVSFVLVASAAFLFSSDAQAVMRGQSAGGISRHVVKLVGNNLLCSATVIGRQQL